MKINGLSDLTRMLSPDVFPVRIVPQSHGRVRVLSRATFLVLIIMDVPGMGSA